MSALRTDDDGRLALAAAIARHAAAVEALERVREAAFRAPKVWEARHAVEAAEAALGEARAGEAGHLVRKLTGEEDRQPGKGRIPPGIRQVVAAFRYGQAPIGGGRGSTHAEEAQYRGDEDGKSHADCRPYDHRGNRVWQDMGEENATTASA